MQTTDPQSRVIFQADFPDLQEDHKLAIQIQATMTTLIRFGNHKCIFRRNCRPLGKLSRYVHFSNVPDLRQKYDQSILYRGNKGSLVVPLVACHCKWFGKNRKIQEISTFPNVPDFSYDHMVTVEDGNDIDTILKP